MSNLISECLKLAQDNSADQMYFQSNNNIKLRSGKDIREIKSSKGQAVNVRQLVSEFLEEAEKTKLFEEMKVSGHKKIGLVSFSFDFQIDFEGISGAIQFHRQVHGQVDGQIHGQESFQWNFSPVVTESFAKKHGLNLLVGPRKSGKSTAIQSILNQIPNKQKLIAVYSDNEGMRFHSHGNLLFNFPISQLVNHGVHSNAEIIVIDSSKADFCEIALSLAEEGLQVILTMPFWSLEMGLARFVDLIGDNSKIAARRLASVLQMGIGVKLVGQDEENTGIFELLINDKSAQQMILQERISELPKVMKEGSEKSGMRTLNQSLFQLMLKRKIDFRAAFEASNDPEELDGLLKKVGI